MVSIIQRTRMSWNTLRCSCNGQEMCKFWQKCLNKFSAEKANEPFCVRELKGSFLQADEIWVLYGDISVCGVSIYTSTRGGVLLEELTGFHLAKILTAFYRTGKFINPFTRARHMCLSYASSNQSTHQQTNSRRSKLIFSFHQRLGLLRGLILLSLHTEPW